MQNQGANPQSPPLFAEAIEAKANLRNIYTLEYSKGRSHYTYDTFTFLKPPSRPYRRVSIRPEFYKDFSSSYLYTYSAVLERGELVREPMEPFLNWELHESDSKKIKGYLCYKATRKDETGSMVIAWYAKDLPIPDGPETYFGLPGLILEVVILDKKYIELETIQLIQDQQVTILIPPAETYISRKEFQARVQKNIQKIQSGNR